MSISVKIQASRTNAIQAICEVLNHYKISPMATPMIKTKNTFVFTDGVYDFKNDSIIFQVNASDTVEEKLYKKLSVYADAVAINNSIA